MSAITIGISGVAGWKTLQRTEARQLEVIAQDPVVVRSTTYFKDNIAKAAKAEELVKDYRLLNTALSAFGLEGDIANKAFIQKVLESDTSDESSLVNRLADKRYLKLAEAFGFGNQAPAADLAETVSQAFVQREYERRVGESDENMRLALNATRELQTMQGRSSTDKTLWYEVIGNQPLKKVFEGAFGFGSSYGNLPVERQLEEFMDAAERILGSSSFKDITTPEVTDKLMMTFMARSQLTESVAQNCYSAALTLLTGL
ncbi:DUF1217 domain-containing protein [Paracoccus sp. R86501]|uniref:DUF1217 domain-containing protein n=1 Tax=Paracoccus sp. R86501 TaxID=3101711 RepID=UPI0036719092